MRLEDIAIVTNTPLTTDSALLEKFKHHDRVAYDPKTDLFSYKVPMSMTPEDWVVYSAKPIS